MKALARRALCATAPLGVCAFWGGIVMAARRYPSEYDWRYMTVSDLVYADRNPAGHLWASAGIVVCGLFWLCWAALQAQRRKQGAEGMRPVGIRALQLGSICMVCCAVLPKGLLPNARGHEILALMAFFGLCLGLVHLTFKAVEKRFFRRTHRSPGGARMWALLLAGAGLSPILLAALTQAYVSYALPELPWVGLSWRARGVPEYLSFAFWEWVTSVVFSAYMAILSVSALSLQQ